jgi:UDP:flavonoid glycosyltransferase YjiC (YdhE family)
MSKAERSMKVLVVWELGANLGHLLRLLPVIKALKARGHKVVLAAPDPAEAHKLLQLPEVECIACPMVRPRGNGIQPSRAVHCYADILAEYAFGEDESFERTLGEWATLISNLQPDRMLIDFAPLALLVARLHRVPAVHVAIGWEAPPAGETLPLIGPSRPGLRDSVVALEASLVKRINRQCAASAMPKLRKLNDLYRFATQLIATLPETDHFGPRQGARYIGPLFTSDHGNVACWQDVHSGHKAFVYLQPAKHNIHILKALATCHVQVIAVLPGITAAGIARLQLAQMGIYAGPVKLAGLLEHADVVISNAGHGLAAAALLNGKRMLLVPQNYEQALLARRIEATGAAHVFVKEKQSVELQAIEALLNDKKAEVAAKSMQAAYATVTANTVIAKVLSAIESPERVNDFATPGVMNLLCGAVDCVRGVSPVVAG